MVGDFLEFSLERANMLALVNQKSWGAYFKLDQDVRSLFPYINSVIPDARYFDQPASIQFLFDKIQSTLYPLEVVAAPFLDKNQALAFFSKLVDFLNDLYNKQKDLRPDHRTYRPLSVIDVLSLLPQNNCRECGYPSCLAFAAALRLGKSVPDLCPGFSSLEFFKIRHNFNPAFSYKNFYRKNRGELAGIPYQKGKPRKPPDLLIR